jgi:histidyl-tRNA synthetase
VITPIFEATELFERGVGESTEVVNKQMYTFTDKGGRSLTLRPEGTAGVVRAFLNSGMQGGWKGSYSGPMFRYERPQKGRYRQFWQVGVEYLDVESPQADSEVIELGYRYLTAAGVPALEVRLNSLGDPQCRPRYLLELREYLLARFDTLCADSQGLTDTNPMRVLDCKICAPDLTDAPAMVDRLCEPCKTHFDSVCSALGRLGIPYSLDSGLVRGLDYYTRTAFEYIALDLDAAQNAVGGGGRYDGLAESIGGRRAPGVGFALGVDRIIISLDEEQSANVDVYLVSESNAEDALLVASTLRAGSLSVDFDAEGRSVKSQFKAATRSGAPFTVIVRGWGEPVEVRFQESRAEMSLDAVTSWIEGRAR